MFRVMCMAAAAVASGLHVAPEPTLDPSNLASRLGAESRLGSGVVRAATSAGNDPDEKFKTVSGALDVFGMPSKIPCEFMEEDVARNLHDYELLFAKGRESRTKIGFIGDSLLEQFYETINCAAQILEMHTEHTDFGTVIKHSANASGGVELHIRKVWKFRKIHDPQSCSPHVTCDISWDAFCGWTEGYDHVFANLMHHELRDENEETHMSFEQIVNTVFEKTQACVLRNNVHWVGHPPSHFNSPDGAFRDPGSENMEFYYSHCTCDLPRERLEQQAIVKNSKVAEQVAQQFGVPYISVWQDFVTKCDKHPHDCLHYVQSPTNWLPLLRRLKL